MCFSFLSHAAKDEKGNQFSMSASLRESLHTFTLSAYKLGSPGEAHDCFITSVTLYSEIPSPHKSKYIFHLQLVLLAVELIDDIADIRVIAAFRNCHQKYIYK